MHFAINEAKRQHSTTRFCPFFYLNYQNAPNARWPIKACPSQKVPQILIETLGVIGLSLSLSISISIFISLSLFFFFFFAKLSLSLLVKPQRPHKYHINQSQLNSFDPSLSLSYFSLFIHPVP